MARVFSSLLFLAGVSAQVDEYYLTPQGGNCVDTCLAQGRNCDPHIVTGETSAIFRALGVQCQDNDQPWWAEDQPSVVVGQGDPNYGKCLGYKNVPGGVVCGAFHPNVRRLCHCVLPTAGSRAFGTGLSQGVIDTTERALFAQVLAPGDYGMLNHFWVTAPPGSLEASIFRYYVDGESKASIEFLPSMACGVGFEDKQAPWGTKWFGKGAKDGAWFNNFQVPFEKSVRVTFQHKNSSFGGFYTIIRGVNNVPINIGNVAVPKEAKLKLYRTLQHKMEPFDWVDLVSLPTGNGFFFMHTLAVASGDLNFLEGCYHAYTPFNQTFPGTLLSTGTEDYFDSAWYFNAGQFHLPVSGFTHLTEITGKTTWSGYRFHEMDPLTFSNGFRFVWRNGDLSSGGIKCFTDSPKEGNAKPSLRSGNQMTASVIDAYAWVYVW